MAVIALADMFLDSDTSGTELAPKQELAEPKVKVLPKLACLQYLHRKDILFTGVT